MNFKLLVVNKILFFRNVVVFLIFYLMFFSYQSLARYDSLGFLFFINILVLLIFLLTTFKAKIGLYLFIFLIPLFNSLTSILKTNSVPILLFFFFAFFMGFLLNLFHNDFKNRLEFLGPLMPFESEISKIFLVFIILLSLSTIMTIFRYSNFFPFITNNYHNIKVNINGFSSNNAILWTLSFFFNYFIGFALFFAIFNVLDKVKEILTAITVLIFSTFLTSIFALYQYLKDPYIGNIKYWVEAGRLNSTFTDPNALGSYCILVFPIFVVLIIVLKKWYLKLISFLIFAPFILMVIFSGSRTALLCIFISIFIFFILGIKRLILYIKKMPKRKKIIVSISIIVISLILIIANVAIFATTNRIKSSVLEIDLIQRPLETVETLLSYNRTAGFLESLKSVSNYRYIFWNQAIRMAKDYPFTGVGVGSYVIELPDYLWNFEPGFTQVDYAGNYYLQVLSEFGFIGLIIILFIFYLIIKKYIIYFKYQKSLNRQSLNSLNNWLLIGFFLSFFSMVLAQFFGPHTNFTEVQFTFWLIIGLMLTFIKVKQVNYEKNLEPGLKKVKNVPLVIDGKISFNLGQKISLIIVLLIFTCSFLFNSSTKLSITAKQDRDNWSNNYGFYDFENLQGKKVRWTADDASEVLEKKGSAFIIPLQDAYPIKNSEPNIVKFYIDNMLIKKIKLEDDSWYNLKIEVPKSVGDESGNRFTLTIVTSRSWVPKELGVNNDTRILGIRIGEISFIE